jgi:hypothetical protein
LETCYKCKTKYWRDFPVRNNWHRHEHETGRTCQVKGCGGELLDTIVNFGEDELQVPWDLAVENMSKADLVIVLGSSLRVRRSCDLPVMCFENNPNAKLVIVNLQKTPHDDRAQINIHARTDYVIEAVMHELCIDIPDFLFERTFEMGIESTDDGERAYVRDCNGFIATVVHGVVFRVYYHDGTVEEKELKYRWDDMEYAMPVQDEVKTIQVELNFNFVKREDVSNVITLETSERTCKYSLSRKSSDGVITFAKINKQSSNCTIN